jgi:L-amino acid N-acyltransferase YncA
MDFELRRALDEDLEQILEIWLQRPGANHDLDNKNRDRYRRFFGRRLLEQNDQYYYMVAHANDVVVGWNSLQPMRNSPTMAETMAEDSMYIRDGWRGRGVATLLRKRTFTGAIGTSLEWIVGYVSVANIGAIRLWESTEGATRLGIIPAPVKNPARGDVVLFGWPVPAL